MLAKSYKNNFDLLNCLADKKIMSDMCLIWPSMPIMPGSCAQYKLLKTLLRSWKDKFLRLSFELQIFTIIRHCPIHASTVNLHVEYESTHKPHIYFDQTLIFSGDSRQTLLQKSHHKIRFNWIAIRSNGTMIFGPRRLSLAAILFF